ncbi:hypothetical protein ACFYO5_15705 [Streptomyces sp. NPDC006259]|uniref:hypothetical protein n=1 Tax=unclassified Streptomyces TaxID=2593676 RepID=UPI0033BA30B4
MISTRRIVAVAALAVGVTGLAAPLAGATEAPAAGKLNPLSALDSLAEAQVPAGRQGELPSVTEQVNQLNNVKRLQQLNELQQVTGLVAPVTGLAPAIRT